MQETGRTYSAPAAGNTAQRATPGTPPTKPSDFRKKKMIFHTYQIIWYVLGVVETLLAFRFFFKLFGANLSSPFVQFIYQSTNGLVRLFRGTFPTPVVEGSVFEWTALVAMAVYAVFAYGIVYLLQLMKPVRPEEIEEAVDNPPV